MSEVPTSPREPVNARPDLGRLDAIAARIVEHLAAAGYVTEVSDPELQDGRWVITIDIATEDGLRRGRLLLCHDLHPEAHKDAVIYGIDGAPLPLRNRIRRIMRRVVR